MIILSQAGYSCGPKSSADVATQADIVNGYAQYTAEAEILENFVSPDELLNVLYTINETLPSLLTHVSLLLDAVSNVSAKVLAQIRS